MKQLLILLVSCTVTECIQWNQARKHLTFMFSKGVSTKSKRLQKTLKTINNQFLEKHKWYSSILAFFDVYLFTSSFFSCFLFSHVACFPSSILGSETSGFILMTTMTLLLLLLIWRLGLVSPKLRARSFGTIRNRNTRNRRYLCSFGSCSVFGMNRISFRSFCSR